MLENTEVVSADITFENGTLQSTGRVIKTYAGNIDLEDVTVNSENAISIQAYGNTNLTIGEGGCTK